MENTGMALRSNEEFPYSNVPFVNNFIYPPFRPFSDDHAPFAELIDLDKPLPPGTLYTMFVSIPFCEVRCHSCHMFKGLLPAGQDRHTVLDDYLEYLFRQIDAYAATARFSSGKCGAIYMGGGTASVLAPDQVKRLVEKIKTSFVCDPEMELTFEGNPNDYSLEYLLAIKPYGITRLSIGYQSSHEATLKSLNSPHRAAVGVAAVKNALQAGFHTVNVDLLFNVPGQTKEQWEKDLQVLIDLGPQGISPGDYVVFSGTPAEALISIGKLEKQHDLDTADRWYQWTREQLEKYGYHEQVRNIFSLQGHPYRYVDLSCKQSREIIGLGAGAYSFIGRRQFQAAGDAESFKAAIRRGEPFHAVTFSPRASDRNLMERYIIHNFFASVLSRQEFRQRFGVDPLDVFEGTFSKLERFGLVSISGDAVRLTELGQKWRRNVYYDFRSPEFRSPEDNIVITLKRPLSIVNAAGTLPS